MADALIRIKASTSEYQQAMRQAAAEMKNLSSEYSLAAAQAKLYGSQSDALRAKITELTKKMEVQNDVVQNNEKQYNNLKEKLEVQKKQHDQLKDKVDAAKKAYEDCAEATGKDSEETQKAKAEYEKLSAQLDRSETSIKKTETAIERQKSAVTDSKAKLAEMEVQLREVNAELARQKFDEYAEKAKKLGGAVETAGKAMLPVTAAIAGVGTAAVKTTADFDAQMSTVQSISGATGDDFDALRKKAVEMGSKTSFSASEASQAMEYMAMAGWSTNDMLEGISGVMDAAAASGEDLATTSDILTDGLTAFGLSAKDSSHFADVLVKTGNSANTSVSMMGETFKYAGAVCGTLGIKVEDAAIATGLMGNAGIKASQAGTALRSGLTNLVKPTNTMAVAMEKYGVAVQTTDDGSVDFMATMLNVRESLGGLDETTRAAAIAQIFGKEAMSGWAAIVTASDKDFQSLTDSIYNCEGAAQQAADVKLDNLSGQITILKSTLEGIAIQIGDVLMPIVRDVVAKIQEWATWFSNLDEEGKKQVIMVGGIIAAIGPLLTIIGKVITFTGQVSSVLGKAAAGLSKVGGMSGLATKAIGGVKAAFGALLSPAGLIVAAVVAVGAAIMHLWKTNEDFRNNVIAIWERVKAAFEGFTEGIRERLSGLGIEFGSVTDAMKAIWEGFCEILAPLIEGILNNIANTIETTFDVILGIWDTFAALFRGDWEGVWNGVKSVVTTIWEGMWKWISNILDTLKVVVDVFLGWFGTNWDSVWNSIKTFFVNIWNSIKTFFVDLWNGIVTFITNILTTIRDFFVNIWTAVSTAVTTAWNTIKNIVQVGIMFVAELIHAAFELITLPFRFIWENCKDTLIQAWEAIKTAVSTAINAVKTTITNVMNTIRTTITTVWNAIKTAITTAVNAIKTAITPVWNAIKTTITTVVNAIKTTVTTVWNAIKTAISTAMNAIKTTITTVWNAIKTAVSTAINAVKTTITNIWNTIKTATTTAWNAVKTAVSTPINAAKTAVSNALNSIKTTVNNIFNSVKTKVSSTWNAIKTAITTPINAAKTAVSNAINAIKSKFNFSWSLPKLKMPHPKITGKFSLNPPQVPKFSIEWYKNGGIMTQPTAFGMSGSTVLAGGEAGPEAILPLKQFYDELGMMLDRKLDQISQGNVVYVYVTLDGDEISAKTATRVENKITKDILKRR